MSTSKTKIQWTDRTWNPVRGCELVNEGCRNCYAMRVAHRFSGPGRPYEGLTRSTLSGPKWTGRVEVVWSELDRETPLHWGKPARIFVNSMSDLFHPGVPDLAISRILGICKRANWHTFQILTKRPDRMLGYQRIADEPTQGNFYTGLDIPNVQLGVSASTQKDLDSAMFWFSQIRTSTRFLSLEPLLEPIYLKNWLSVLDTQKVKPIVDWIIVGGESGPGARATQVSWILDLIKQARAARSKPAIFIKQLGRNAIDDDQERVAFSGAGGDWDEWPDDLKVREFPAQFK